MDNTLSTKDLKRVLTFKDLLGAAIGQIIGAGVMSLMGIAIGMTGRSVPISFLIAASFSILTLIPSVIISGTLRLRGGQYTIAAVLGGKKLSGLYLGLYIFVNLSISMYALSFADYFLGFFPHMNARFIAFLVLTIFYVLNLFGVDKMAKVQNIIVLIMCIALGMFAVLGCSKISPNYFSSDFMPNGPIGVLSAASLLTWATGGAAIIVGLSGEAKNPTRDIPRACIISTLFVALLYAFIAAIAAGVLPVAEVAYKPLTDVAKEILPAPLFVFFMIGGAMFALISTLNAQLASSTKPLLQGCVDGWLPKKLAYLHPKYKTPIALISILYIIGLIPIMTGLNIGAVATMANVVTQVILMIINMNLYKIPKLVPDAWEKSKFRVKQPVLNLFTILSVIVALLQIYLMLKGESHTTIIGSIIMLILAIGYTFWRANSGKVQMEISYESD